MNRREQYEAACVGHAKKLDAGILTMEEVYDFALRWRDVSPSSAQLVDSFRALIPFRSGADQ